MFCKRKNVESEKNNYQKILIDYPIKVLHSFFENRSW